MTSISNSQQRDILKEYSRSFLTLLTYTVAWQLRSLPMLQCLKQHQTMYAEEKMFLFKVQQKNKIVIPHTKGLSIFKFSCTQSTEFLFCFVLFLGPYPEHMEVPRLGIKLVLQLEAYATARTTPDPSCICNLCLSLQQHEIFNTLSGARNQTHILTEMSGHTGPQWELIYIYFLKVRKLT